MDVSDVASRVLRLKQRLTDTSSPATLQKTMEKLQDLDISLDILSETGIGKTVNSFRKHADVGEFAKSLVKYWKTLVFKDSTRKSVDSNTSESTQQKEDPQKKVLESNAKTDKNRDYSKSWSKSSEMLLEDSRNVDRKRPEDRGHKEKKVRKDISDASLERETSPVTPKKCDVRENLLDIDSLEDENNNTVTSKKKSRRSSNCHNAASNHRSRDKTCISSNRKEVHGSKDSDSRGGPSKGCNRRSSSSRHSDSEEEDSRSSNDGRKSKRSKRESDVHPNVGSKDRMRPQSEASSDSEMESTSMSFESYLSYDANMLQRTGRKVSMVTAKKPMKPKKHRGGSYSKPSSLGNGVVNDKMKTLLNTPLPEFLPETELKLSTADYLGTKKVVKDLDEDEPEPLFTGQRLHKKMAVYSGNKTAFLPTMMSLYEQCIRTLQNNINALYDTGGVPFEILEPVLERCTPDQLLRIEEYNPGYIGVSDHLWGKHCERDFREAKLLEYESWKEMYIRLSEERENKFKRLAKTIVNAHSKKPTGRQVKMAFIHTVAKPPRDVRIQQEINGTAGPLLPPIVKASVTPHKHRARPSSHQEKASSSVSSHSPDPRKKTRIAPMMAKSLKTFKKMGRRR